MSFLNLPLLIAEALSKPLQWWQITTGILAVPTAVIGLIYTFTQIQRTRVDIQKTRADIKKTEVETTKLIKDLSEQKQELSEQKLKLDEMTVFLFNNFINEAELKHLENLESTKPYPFDKTGYAEDELRNLRDARLITVRGGSVTKLPRQIPDLHEHASLTETASYYLERRRALKTDKVY